TMQTTLLESNPLVEETKNQVAIKRGPLVYCLESADLPNNNIFNVAIPAAIKFKEMPIKMEGSQVVALYGDAKISKQTNWKNSLYKELNNNLQPIKIKLIPYYAWANRGSADMIVWMNLLR
ncbi:MAG: glycoside hydrolase family 127 protein, partial [Ferruginibacter sp.]|nr:glycoside hydrolase family 127 protein [Ferruginibacter sp.]